ncbi:MAG: hypothetical protein HC801_07850 [Nitrospira sp.]|nr:hypothetical protein [Nitrospira sp.]
MFTAWAVFLASAAVIVYAGTKLSRYGDQIADLTGLGGLWVGVVLMAGATSLPEVFTTVSASLLDAPDLAAGDLFGACMTNMLTLGLIDLMHRQKRVWQQAAFEHALSAGLAMFLTGLAAFFILLGHDVKYGGIGLGSIVLLLFYILGMRVIFRQESVKRRQREQEKVIEGQAREEERGPGKREGLQRAAVGFGLGAVALLIAAPFLASSAKSNCRTVRCVRNVYRHVARGHYDVASRTRDGGGCSPVGRVRPRRRQSVREQRL